MNRCGPKNRVILLTCFINAFERIIGPNAPVVWSGKMYWIILNFSAEVFGYVDNPTVIANRNAYSLSFEIRCQNIFPMSFALHPSVHH